MSHRVEKLRTLVRLRRRNVDRRACAAAEGARAAEAAEIACRRVEAMVNEARRKQERALSERLRAPADPMIALFVRTSEATLSEARQQLRKAEIAMADAIDRAAALRQQWLRAQARLDALTGLLDRALLDSRRATERRRMDALAEGRRGAPAFA
jgi:flagellar biosynthesis chaperone FliJ